MLKNPPQKIVRKAAALSLDLRKRVNPRTWPSNSIAIYATETPYQWSPISLQTGIGGAEGRIIHLARTWAKQGYQVEVFNSCGERAGVFDGVVYRHHSEFNRHDTFDTLMVWHFAWRLKFPVKANRVWLDLGKGVLLPEESTYEKLGQYDKIFCKNNFHRSTLPDIPDHKIAVIPNGLDGDFQHLKGNIKNPHKVIYASNYSRGLEYMLEFGWPLIKQAVPEAELHIFYGWPKQKPSEWREKMQRLMQQPGVIEHGKVSRQRLMEEKSTSIIHYYGCTFDEIDCNTVRESAFVGCIPVTTNYAGLQDKDYCLKVAGNPFASETQAALAQKIIELLKDAAKINELRQQFQSAVQAETWENVAAQWLSEI